MKTQEQYEKWKQEENDAHIHGWDFSHRRGRYKEEQDLPWNYEEIVKKYLTDEKRFLNYDTSGAKFLLSLKHPYAMTAATERYKPNVQLCKGRRGDLPAIKAKIAWMDRHSF